MVDVDHFKRINDSHGHAMGDQVLQRVAAVMVQSVRAGDILGRWGGEEFIVACVHCTAEHAVQVAEKIRQRIEATPFGTRQRIHVTASFGVAAMHDMTGFAETLRRADEALYRAKSEGRNRVVVDVAEG
jgi:diguanylate cyclase (GGDEF)-like protein